MEKTVPSKPFISDEAIKLGLQLNNLFYNLLTIEKVVEDDEHLQQLIDERSKQDPDLTVNDTFYMDRSVLVDFEKRKSERSPVQEIIRSFSEWSDKSFDVCRKNVDNLWNVPVYNHICEHLDILKQIRVILTSVDMPYKQFEEAQKKHLYEDIHEIKALLEF